MMFVFIRYNIQKTDIGLLALKMFVFIRYNIQKTDIGLIASVGVGFCDKKDTENCVVYVSLLDNVVMPLPICKADGTLTWPQGMLLLEYEMGFFF